ncbi:hypothetical protein HN358_03215 [Candidatus Uhrbacteria bacterium]|nr:hypothetical protein [Candidatus Uhrbacteria bacterium]MBT7717635.1 hypothetical protein [Candidatus Uhrbacteria bacterium]
MGYNDHLLAGLETYGLSKKEAEIYLSILHLGPATVLQISRKTQYPRTTLYPILDILVAKGVLRSGKDKKKTVFAVEPPKVLRRKLKEKEVAFDDISSELGALYDHVAASPDIILYEGTDGFKRLWQRIYNSEVKEYRILTSATGMLEYVKVPYIIKSVIARRIELGIKSLQIVPDNPETRRITQHDKKQLRESRFLPNNTNIPATIIQFGDEIAFMTTRRENAMIIMASGDVALTFKTMFDLVWKCAKNPYSEI